MVKLISSLGGAAIRLGKHRVLCGSTLSSESYPTLMAGRSAAVVFTDPPYNVRIDGHVSGKGKVRHREFQMASGEMDEFEFTSFLTTSLRRIAQHSTRGSIHFVCMDSDRNSLGKRVTERISGVVVFNGDGRTEGDPGKSPCAL